MKITQERLPDSQLGLEIEIPAETTKKVYEKVVRNLSRSANIPGFRKGKVPRQILLQRMGVERIKEAAVEDLVQDSLKQAIEQENIEALGNYKLISKFDELSSKFKPGEPLIFSASVDTPPMVNLSDYSGLSVKAEETKPEPEAVDKFLEERRVEQATLIPVESRPAQMGDVVVVDYTGRFKAEGEEEEGDLIPGGEASDFQIELEEEKFLPDFVQGIVGMNPEETKEILVTFPEDYAREELAGESVVFHITLQEVKEKELPELDDDFAQEISEMETLAELQESLSEQFKQKADQETTQSKEQVLVAALLEKIEVELPKTMIDQEVENLIRQSIMQLQQMGMNLTSTLTPEMVQQMQEKTRPEAIVRLKQSLALEEVAKRESLVVEPEVIQTRINEWMEQLAGQEVDPGRLREVVESDLLKEKAVEWLAEHARIELVPKGSLTPEGEIEAPTTEAEDTTTATLEVETDETTQTIDVTAEPSTEE
ncbi:MAG: trigger factor [Symploca sp. SIO2E6]|nr:trigger factor [Symploca sp. SIO2E6]